MEYFLKKCVCKKSKLMYDDGKSKVYYFIEGEKYNFFQRKNKYYVIVHYNKVNELKEKKFNEYFDVNN